MLHYNTHITGWYSPLYTLNNLGFSFMTQFIPLRTLGQEGDIWCFLDVQSGCKIIQQDLLEISDHFKFTQGDVEQNPVF